jgi:hypothetical protein
MSSLKQIEANRRNALKSTGPSTREGKERSRRNAVRHGLAAETVIADLEDAGDYKAFEEAVIADYDVQTAVERELVLRLASVLWRLRRAIGIESGIFEKEQDDSNSRINPPNMVSISLLAGDGSECDVEVKKIIADRFLKLSELPTLPFDRLSRYEHRLWRQGRQLVLTLKLLSRGQRRKAIGMSVFHPSRTSI